MNQILSSGQLLVLVEHIKANPQEYAVEPFEVLDGVWYVGNRWVAAYLIDTGDGLILFDSNFEEVLPLLVRNIEKAGFSLGDIRLLLLSHGHFDHIGGACFIQQCSKCRTYFPEKDLFMLKERRELLYDTVRDFRIDAFYQDDKPIVLGNTCIQSMATPGHTCGCTSFFFNREYHGGSITVGIHGGLGLNGLKKKELTENRLPLSLQKAYEDQLKECRKKHVDVFLPLHNSYYDILSLKDRDTGDHSVFIQEEIWPEIINDRLNAIENLIAVETEQER